MAKKSEEEQEPQQEAPSLLEQIQQRIIESINVLDIKKYFDHAKLHRQGGWEQRWQEIQEVLYPDFRDYVGPSTVNSKKPPTKGYGRYSSAASNYVHNVVSMLSAHTADPSIKWLGLRFYDPCFLANGMPLYLQDIEPARHWLERQENALYSLFANPNSNFYPSSYSLYFDWFSLGTACREVIRRKDTGDILFNTVSMGEMYLEPGPYGDISRVYRLLCKTPLQALNLWGHKFLQHRVEAMLKANTFDVCEFLEVTQPNPLHGDIEGFPLGQALPETITYVIDLQSNQIIDLDMHNYSPYVVSRFDVAPNNVYGRSCVWLAMPAIKGVNKLNRDTLKGVSFGLGPTLLAQDLGALNPAQIIPDGLVAGLDMHGNPTIKPMPTVQNIPFLMDFIRFKSDEMADALVARDIFAGDTSNMTATEANLRKLQSMNRLRPMLIRLEREDLNRTVLKSLSLLQESGKVDAFPYGEIEAYLHDKGVTYPAGWLQQLLPYPLRQINITFSGMMARMQRMQDLHNIDMLFQKGAQYAQADQSVLDLIDFNEALKEAVEVLKPPLRVLRSEQTVQMIRQQRQAAMRAEAEARQEAAEAQQASMLNESASKAQQQE